MPQYLLRQPKDLQHLAIVKTGDWIAVLAETLMLSMLELYKVNITEAEALLSRYIDTIRTYLDIKVPKIYHDMITAETIRALKETFNQTIRLKTDCHKNIIIIMIETLFTKNLSSLWISHHIYRIFQTSFCSKSHLLTGLVHLKIDTDNTSIIHVLKELHSLKYLEISNCTVDIFRCIADNCKLIEELDVTFKSHRYFNECIKKALTQLRNLKKIKLNSMILNYVRGEPTHVFIILLDSCENIEHIDLCLPNVKFSTDFAAIKYSRKKLNLKTYRSVDDSRGVLQSVVQICPLIQKIRLVKKSNVRGNLMVLTGLQNVCELQLFCYNFHDQVTELLKVIGHNLVYLELQNVYDIDLNALMDMSQMCPNLEGLKLGVLTPFVKTPWYRRKLDIPPFRNLKTLSCGGLSRQWNQPTFVPHQFDEQLFFLLSNCLNIEYIQVCIREPIKQDTALNIVRTNPFICLKQLIIWPHNILFGEILVGQIIQNGISKPEVIVQKLV